MSPIASLTNYMKGSYHELKKVVWPSRNEVIRHTTLVIAISVCVALFIAIVDFILTTLLGLVI